MSEVKKSRMRPRLGQLMAQKGGIYVGEALKRADATLETLREPSLVGIGHHIAARGGRRGPPAPGAARGGGGPRGPPPPDGPARIEGLYARAADIVSLCGAERNEAVEIAARSLCDLLDEAGALTPTVQAGVKVHVASIKLLHRADANSAMQDIILQGLASVLEKQRGETAEKNSAA
ncbi:hypothetical protein [Caulobacter sp. DWP3-1-3b2]|uniref:hypothetical protein n=1 Tax=Caulobacter sp. DWP3-1-3b2 TaxID=2804643 RepID=UPI003CEDA65B